MIVTDGLLMKLTIPSGNDLTNKWATLASLETIHYQHPGHINRESSVYIFVVGQKFRRATLLSKKSRECNDLFGILDHLNQITKTFGSFREAFKNVLADFVR